MYRQFNRLRNWVGEGGQAKLPWKFAFALVGCGILLAMSNGAKGHDSAWDSSIILEARSISFSDALRAISSQANINILANDLPMKSRANLEIRGDLQHALEIISARFDVRWTRLPSGDVLFKKRFRDVFEHPQINYPEATFTANRMLKNLSHLGTRPRADAMPTALRQLFSTFTPEQRASLAAGNFLPVRTLPNHQRHFISLAILHNVFGRSYEIWETLLSKLKGLEDSVIEIDEHAEGGAPRLPDLNPGRVFSEKRVLLEWRDDGKLFRRSLISDPEVSIPLRRGRG